MFGPPTRRHRRLYDDGAAGRPDDHRLRVLYGFFERDRERSFLGRLISHV